MPLLVRDLHFSKDDLAQVIFFFSLAYAAGQFLTGTLADRLGAKTVVAVGMVLSAGCTLAMTWGSTLWFFAAMQLINGLAQSAGWPGLLKITGAWFDPSRRGVLMAWWSTNYVVGGFLATIAATWFATGPLAPEWGWKRGAAGPAFLLGLITLVFLVLVKERPSEADPRISAGRAWRQVLSSPQIHCIAASYFCLKLTRYSFLYWLWLDWFVARPEGPDLYAAFGERVCGLLSTRATMDTALLRPPSEYVTEPVQPTRPRRWRRCNKRRSSASHRLKTPVDDRLRQRSPCSRD